MFNILSLIFVSKSFPNSFFSDVTIVGLGII